MFAADELESVICEPCELFVDLRLLDGSSLLPLDNEAPPADDSRDWVKNRSTGRFAPSRRFAGLPIARYPCVAVLPVEEEFRL